MQEGVLISSQLALCIIRFLKVVLKFISKSNLKDNYSPDTISGHHHFQQGGSIILHDNSACFQNITLLAV